jgi:hypothetical protein
MINAVLLSFGFLLANGNSYDTNGTSSSFFIGVILLSLSQLSMSMAVSTLFRTKVEAFSASLWLMLIPFAMTVFAISEILTQV